MVAFPKDDAHPVLGSRLRVRLPRRVGLRAHLTSAAAVRALEAATGLAAAVPVLDSTVSAVRAGWVPAGDDGIIATRSWDVLTSHTPLVGQYSEAGQVLAGQTMHSAGPMLYWLLALPARFGRPVDLAITMGAINTLAIIACVILARRRGGLILMFAVAAGIALMAQSLPTEAMHDVWNPAAGLFPFLLLIFLCWSAACGEHRLLPAAALVGSFVVQTHLMYLAPTAVLFAVAFAGLTGRAVTSRRREARGGAARSRPRVGPWALAAVAVAAVCWAPPAIDQLENDPGNLAMIVRTAQHRGATLGAGAGRRAVARSVGVRPWWLYVPASEWERKADVRAAPLSRLQSDSAIAILLLLAAVGAGGALARRWELASAAAIGLGLSAAIGLEAASNPSGRLLSGTLGYTMWWGSELGLWVWLIVAWGMWLSVLAAGRRLVRQARLAKWSRLARQSRLSRWRRLVQPGRARAVAVATACTAALAGVAVAGAAVASDARRDSHAYDYRPIRSLAATLEAAIPPGRTVAFHFGPLDMATQPMEPAIRYLLVRHGDRPLADGSFPRLGDYYVQGHRRVQWVVHLADGTRAPRRMRLVGRVRFVSPWGRETLSAWVRRA